MSAVTTVAPVQPEYKLGDLAKEDIISSVTIRVVNPERSNTLKRQSTNQAPLIYRHVVTAADDAEAELRNHINSNRIRFLRALQRQLPTGMLQASDLDSLAYVNAISEVTQADPNPPPLTRLAPLWIRGLSDAALVESLLQPLREVMTQYIVNDNTTDSLAVDQPIRLIRVKNELEMPSLPDLETSGVTATAANLSSLDMVHGVVESYFSSDEAGMARFVASFIRANTFPAPGLTELLRAKGRDEVVEYDTYAAGQVLVKKGQRINEKALAVLAAVREKKDIEKLLSQLETKSSGINPLAADTWGFLAWLGGAGLVLLLILWRWGNRSTRASGSALEPEIHDFTPYLIGKDAALWRTRALAAEQRAERAHEAIRQGAVGWMKEKVFGSIFRQRADLLSTQRMAEAEMAELERRLEYLLIPLQGRIRTYENRIKELETILAAQDGAERRLIDARITRTKQQLELERSRLVHDI